VDAAALVVEAGRWTDDDGLAYSALRQAGVPVVLVINKVDKLAEKAQLLPYIAQITREREFAAVHPISALKGKGLEALVKDLVRLMPASGPLYGEDEITDRSQRFLAGELIREQLMLRLGEELPYSTTVEIERFEEDGELLRIAAVIWVEREGQKAIVIGKGGERIKAIAIASRQAMQSLFGRQVFLETWCRVREGWSDDEAALRRFGYSD
jgi:GTP-binding protein Era